MNKKKVAIIGAGASGLIAGICAARNGCQVTIFEKEKKIARKLSITGNGQCNITNRNISIKKYHGKNPRALNNIFSRFSLDDVINFFEELGIPFAEGKKGKLYPHSFQAASVVSILEYELIKLNVKINLHRRIDKIEKNGDFFNLTTAGHEKYKFDSVILCSGSCTYSQIGGTTLGYELAAKFGHFIIDPFPAILPLNIPLKKLHKLEGVKWDSKVSVLVNGKIKAESVEELLFTKYGISGPATLEISRWVNEAILKNYPVEVMIDLFPGFSIEGLKEFLDKCYNDKTKTIAFALSGILKKRMPEVFLSIAGIDPEIFCKNLSAKIKGNIVLALKELKLKPGEPRGFNEAVVAAGGIDIDEINPSTMESKKVKGLFITGEVLDIDGDSGGFNLQFAWSSGALAGLAQ